MNYMDAETIDFLYIFGWVVVGILLIWRIYTGTLFDIVKSIPLALILIALFLFVIYFFIPMLTEGLNPPPEDEDCYGMGTTYTC